MDNMELRALTHVETAALVKQMGQAASLFKKKHLICGKERLRLIHLNGLDSFHTQRDFNLGQRTVPFSTELDILATSPV